MDFKKPQTLKRYSDSDTVGSPCNRKKTKLLSTTIATPETRKKDADPFDDNFSQFFRSQFIRQIDADTSIVQNAVDSKHSSTSEYNFSQIDGLSQFLNDTQFESSITSGQRCTMNESISKGIGEIEEVEADRNEKLQFTIQDECLEEPITEEKCESGRGNEKKEGEEVEPDCIIQSSQAFLRELTTLQLNISSIVDETINASKFCTQDFLDPGQYQFDVFKSNVTASQYFQAKRPNEAGKRMGLTVNSPKAESAAKATYEKSGSPIEMNTEMIDDQLLAEMVFTTLNRNLLVRYIAIHFISSF